jgi:hypothetical protein
MDIEERVFTKEQALYAAADLCGAADHTSGVSSDYDEQDFLRV